MNRLGRSAAFLTVTAVVAASVVGCSSPSPTTETASPAASSSTTESQSPSETAPEQEPQQPEAFEAIPAGLDSQELGEALVDKAFTDWLNYGATPELKAQALAYMRENGADKRHDFLIEVAKKNAEIIVPTLFADGWEDNDVVAHFINTKIEANAAVMGLFVSTYDSLDPAEDIEPFRAWEEVTNIQELTSPRIGDRMLRIDALLKGNTDKNRADDLGSTVYDAEGTPSYLEVAVDEVDGEVKIVDINLARI